VSCRKVRVGIESTNKGFAETGFCVAHAITARSDGLLWARPLLSVWMLESDPVKA